MYGPKPANPDEIYDRERRAVARLARMATLDTINGGARALVLAKRMDRINPGAYFQDVVSVVYGNSTGSTCKHFGAWSCPECGSVHVGIDDAFSCCQN